MIIPSQYWDSSPSPAGARGDGRRIERPGEEKKDTVSNMEGEASMGGREGRERGRGTKVAMRGDEVNHGCDAMDE